MAFALDIASKNAIKARVRAKEDRSCTLSYEMEGILNEGRP